MWFREAACLSATIAKLGDISNSEPRYSPDRTPIYGLKAAIFTSKFFTSLLLFVGKRQAVARGIQSQPLAESVGQ